MTKLTWLFALCLQSGAACASASGSQNCVDVSELHPATQLRVTATSCRVSSEKYDVVVAVFKGKEKLQQMNLDAEGVAYQPAIESSLDINADGVVDLGIATGKGRAGDGMHYWLHSAGPIPFVDAGEAPQIAWTTGGPRVLFALIPGSGDVQSTRLEYQVCGHSLEAVRALEFKPHATGGFEMTSLRRQQGSPNGWVTVSSKRLSDEAARTCMDGGGCE